MIAFYGRWGACVSADGPIVTYGGWHAYGPFAEFTHAASFAAGMAEEDPEGARLPAGSVAARRLRGGDANHIRRRTTLSLI